MKPFQRLLSAALITTVLATQPALSQPVASSRVADVVVNMRDVDLADVAQQISRITGRTLILDPSV